MYLQLRFDLRNPDFAGVTSSERVHAAVEMARWADEHGASQVMVLEHHASDDGYLPSPVVMASAMAAVTSRVRIHLVLVVPFYDPLRLAEDLAVLDCLSQGRIDVTLAAGYARHELAMFDVDPASRGALLTDAVETLRSAWTGAPFEYRGRTVRITPRPHREQIPLTLAGASHAAARRAARIGDGFLPVAPTWWDTYRTECTNLDRPDPGPLPEVDRSTVVLDEDPEAAWEELIEYFVHETNAYAAWLDDAATEGPFRAGDPAQVRAGGQYRIITPETYVSELAASPFAFANLQPMVGGIPPARGWKTLELFATKVLPALTGETP